MLRTLMSHWLGAEGGAAPLEVQSCHNRRAVVTLTEHYLALDPEHASAQRHKLLELLTVRLLPDLNVADDAASGFSTPNRR